MSTDETQIAASKPEWAMSRREIEAMLRARAGLPPVRRRWWVWMLISAIVVALGAAAYLRTTQDGPPEVVAESAPEIIAMQILPSERMVVTPQTLQRTVRITGGLRPARQTQIAPEVSGRITEITAEPGDVVNRGDVLLRIDPETLNSELEASRIAVRATQVQLDLARADLERAETLAARRIGTAVAAEQAGSNVAGIEANLDSQQEQVRAAELRVQNAEVTAPFDGVIATRDADVGAYASAGSPIFTLVDLTEMRMDATAPSATATGVREGMNVEISVEGYPDERFAGRVARVLPITAEGTRALRFTISIDNPDGVLRGGLFASGMVVTQARDDALGLPQSAVRQDEDGTHVLRIRDEVAERADAMLGESWPNGVVEVSAGVKPGDIIITAPLSSLDAGAPVMLMGE